MIKHLMVRSRPPRLGRIRLGIKKTTTRSDGRQVSFPAEVPYFVLPPELIELFPTEPTEIDVMLPSNDPEIVLPSEYVRYQGSGGPSGGVLTLRCDGETYTEIPLNAKEPATTGPCKRPLPEPGSTYIEDCVCGATARGRLRVMVLKGAVGYYEVPVGGNARIMALHDELQTHLKTFGRLTGIPFKLTREPATVQVPTDSGKRIPKLGWPVHIRTAFSVEDALRARGLNPYELRGDTEVIEPRRAIGVEPHPPQSPRLAVAEHVESDDEVMSPEDDEEEGTEAPTQPEVNLATLLSSTPPAPREVAQPPATHEADDFSMIIKRAADLGISQKLYETFLLATYYQPLAELEVDSAVVTEQKAMFDGATQPMAKDALKATIIAKANQYLKGQRS